MIKKLFLSGAKQYHQSWLFTWLSLGILVGTCATLWIAIPTTAYWLLLCMIILVVAFIRRNITAIVGVIFAGLIFGLWRGSVLIELQMPFNDYTNKSVTVGGRVASDPSFNNEGDMQIRLVDIALEGQSVGGELWLATTQQTDVKRSDRIIASGILSEGFGNIPAAIHRARISTVNRQDYADVGREVRDWFASGIRKSIIEPEASLGAGFLVGQKSTLPEKLDQELRLLSLTHIVVASGYNLSILVRGSRRLFARISRYTAAAASSLLVLGFLQITGSSPSMVRASIITLVSLAAWFYGRRLHPVVLLLCSAAATVAIHPAYAWGDIGWLLSFSAFAGVIMLSPLIHAYFWGANEPGVIRQIVIETISAMMLTLPIVAFVYGTFSPLSLLANLLIVPFIPVAMLLTFIAGIGGILLPNVAGIIGKPAELLLSYMTFVVDYLSQWTAASVDIKVTLSMVVASYLAIITIGLYLQRRTGYQLRNYNIVE